MRKFTTTLFVSLLVITQAIAQKTNETRFIEVTGAAEMKVEPDLIVIELELKEEVDYTTEESTVLNNNAEAAVKEMLSAKKIDLKMLESAQSNELFGKAFGSKGSKKFTLQLASVASYNDVKKGLDSMMITNKLKSVATSKHAQYMEEASLLALQNAKTKAEKMAKTMGVTVSKVLAIIDAPIKSQGSSLEEMMDLQKMMFSKLMAEAGTTDIMVTINYELRVKFELQ
ncbi:MAG: SIMPL domain-containing protein [Bacteroidota bacterium]